MASEAESHLHKATYLVRFLRAAREPSRRLPGAVKKRREAGESELQERVSCSSGREEIGSGAHAISHTVGRGATAASIGGAGSYAEEIGSGAHARPGCGTTHHKMTGGHQLARMLAAETGGALSSATSAAAWAAAAAAARTHQVGAVTKRSPSENFPKL